MFQKTTRYYNETNVRHHPGSRGLSFSGFRVLGPSNNGIYLTQFISFDKNFTPEAVTDKKKMHFLKSVTKFKLQIWNIKGVTLFEMHLKIHIFLCI